MANIKSAKKRIKVIQKKTATNRRVKDHLKSAIKSFETAIAEGDLTLAKEKLVLVEKRLRKAAARNTIHSNTASRKVSKLTKKYNAAVKAD